MLGILFVYPLFVASCVAGIIRPYYGLLGFYAFVFLEPEWNWRWSIPEDSEFQKYVGVCVLIGVLLTGMRGNRFSGWLGVSVFSLLGFLALAYLSSLQSHAPTLTEFYLDVITKVILMAIVTAKLVDTPRKAVILLWVVCITQGYNAMRINEQYFQDGYSLYATITSWGTKGDNNLYSIFTIPAMAASTSLVMYSLRWWARSLAGGVLILQMHQIMLLESRGCMLGALFMFAVAILLMPKNRYTIRVTVLAVLGGAALAGPPVIEEFTSSFESAENRDSSAESRFDLWKAGIAITGDYPLLGVGPFAGQTLVGQYSDMYAGKDMKDVHNLALEVSSGCGIPAALLYFNFFLIPWCVAATRYWRERDLMSREVATVHFALVVGVPGYLLSSMFSSGALLESSYLLVAGAAVILTPLPRTDVDGHDPNPILGVVD